ncbi:MAG: response regulator [Aequorivita sp.]
MRTQHLNILMIDDHALILKSFEEGIRSLENQTNAYRFQIERAHSILEAVDALDNIFENRQLHLVLLDIGLPRYNKYLSGFDLGVTIRKQHPDCKIIVITGYTNYPLIQKLLDSIKPEGLLLKNELSPDGLKAAIIDVLQQTPHYSKTVRKYLTHIQTMPKVLDHYDVLLLYYISEGKQTKELPAFLPISIASIERRKRKLKEILHLEPESSDVQLLNRAKEEGFL